jgi:hypothetical protein
MSADPNPSPQQDPGASAAKKERPQKPPLRARMRARWPKFRDLYLTVDPRSAGLARIGLGLLLFYDLCRRIGGIHTWYTNEGLLPNHAVLWRPDGDYVFSFFFAASTAGEVKILFFLVSLVYLCLLVGWHTRIAHVLAFFCMVSVHSRGTFLENGGDVAQNLLCAWTMFLPMGRRFSVDAVLASLRAKREREPAELQDRSGWRALAARPIVSLAVLGILLQVSVIYYFNAVHKHGWTWREGKAIHYVLYQERMVTWFGVFVRPYITPILSMIMTYATLLIEISGPVLILNPKQERIRTRTIAIFLYPALHLVFAAFLNLGQFSFNMMGYFPLMLVAKDWDFINRLVAPPASRARKIAFDPGSPLVSAFARLLARLDAFDRLTFVAAGSAGVPRPVDTRLLVINEATGQSTTGALAFAECLDALALGHLLAKFFRTKLGRSIFDVKARFVLHREKPIEDTLRLRAIDHPVDVEGEDGVGLLERGEAPARLWLRRRAANLREATLSVLFFCVASQVLMENKAVPPQLKWAQPKWIQQVLGYPRLFQGWGMFSSDVPTGERMLYVDAVTFGGRHVDPYNEAGSRVAKLPVERIPEHMEQDEFWCDYTNRIPDRQVYWRMLKEWILAYHLRTGQREDRIISFEAKLLESDSPPPGEHEPRNIRTKVMMTERD